MAPRQKRHCQSIWLDEGRKIPFLQHFVSNLKCSKPHPCLLLVDNPESHMSIEGAGIYKVNWITMLSFLPHCSHGLQPLDISVYGVFKICK